MRAPLLAWRPRTRVSWAEFSFAAFNVVMHAAAVWENSRPETQDLPHLRKWFDEAFGIPSPTSGTTRAVLALDRGDVRAAFLYNPVATLVAAFGIAFVVYLPLSILRRRYLEPSLLLRRVVFRSLMGAFFACWIVKILWVPERWW